MNVRDHLNYHSVSSFEFTRECVVFDLFGITLYHV